VKSLDLIGVKPKSISKPLFSRSPILVNKLEFPEALDEVAAEWKKIVKRIGADTVREAYAVGVALEDNL